VSSNLKMACSSLPDSENSKHTHKKKNSLTCHFLLKMQPWAREMYLSRQASSPKVRSIGDVMNAEQLCDRSTTVQHLHAIHQVFKLRPNHMKWSKLIVHRYRTG
jgi:hypothetical protein